MYIPKRELVEAAFAESSSRPLLAEMERRYDKWLALRELIRDWRSTSDNHRHGMDSAFRLCAAELENILDKTELIGG